MTLPRGRVMLHMPLHMAAPDGTALPPFYRKLRNGVIARGGVCVIVHRDLDLLAVTRPEPDFDFVHNGRIRRAGALNTGLAYISPFWYADPIGVFADSALALASFQPDSVAAGPASGFFRRLVERHKTARKSRYDQPEDRRVFAQGAIAVFLQDLSDPVERARHMSARQMLAAVLADSGGRRVIVKPHPRNLGTETADILRWLGQDHPDVIVTDANLHDILATAAVSVSISSAVSLEGMIHRVPAILFGRSDLHHCAVTVQRASDWPAALAQALATDWPYEKFLWWFLREGVVDQSRADMVEQVIARMVAQGADLVALGLAE